MRSITASRLIQILTFVFIVSCSQEEITDLDPVLTQEVFSFAQTQPVEDQYIVVVKEVKVSGRLMEGNVDFHEALM